MPESVAVFIVNALGLYLGVGLLVAVVLQVRGLGRLDPAAEGAGIGFRLLVLPGLIALWPILATRAVRGEGPPAERNAHRDAAGAASE